MYLSHNGKCNMYFNTSLLFLAGTGVTSYSLHPGAIVTELGRHAPILNLPVISQVSQLLLTPILKDAYHGARTQVYLAVEPGVESDNGKYFR